MSVVMVWSLPLAVEGDLVVSLELGGGARILECRVENECVRNELIIE
jgi:hypothetical protein